MSDQPLTDLLINARESGNPLPATTNIPVPENSASADKIQLAVVQHFGKIGGYKVFQAGQGEGKWGAIPARRILASPATLPATVSECKVEAEIAFRFAKDLPPRKDHTSYSEEDIRAAIASALPVFELLEKRFPAIESPGPLLIQADAMANSGLVIGPEIQAWQSLVTSELAIHLEIGGKIVVDQRGGHPSGHPAHPLTWLANVLAKTDHWIKASDIVTTGSFGGSHTIQAGETAIARIEGFAEIRFKLTGK